MLRPLAFVAAAFALSLSAIHAQTGRDAPLDKLLDTYVRDGRVYYRALSADRATLDWYVRGLDMPAGELAAWPRAEREAFWLNAYNALVLQTVVANSPIHGSSALYPRNSIRQVPGAFERLTHRVAGSSLTLDAIEQRMLAEFGDARLVLALGRGALGSGRLRSEAYQADRVETQLQDAVKECAARLSCVAIDRDAKTLTVTPMIGWRTEAFERSFGSVAGADWPTRSAIERAVAAMLLPALFPSEQAFLKEDTFRLTYGEFDWSLNEL